MNRSSLAALFGALVLLGSDLLSTGSPDIFVNETALFMVVGGTILLLVASCGWRGAWSVFLALGVLFRQPAREQVNPAVLSRMDDAIRFLYGTATLSAVMAMVSIMANLDDPSMIGPNIAVILIAPFTAMVLAEFLLRPARLRLGEVVGEGSWGQGRGNDVMWIFSLLLLWLVLLLGVAYVVCEA